MALLFCRPCGTRLGVVKRPAIPADSYLSEQCQGCGEIRLVAAASSYKINVVDAQRAIAERKQRERENAE